MNPDRSPNRRDFLKAAGTAATAAVLLPHLEAMAEVVPAVPEGGSIATGLASTRRVQPFALSHVTLRESVFTQKRDRMLAYARGYGGTEDILAGPDRFLSIFRTNAGLDTKGAQPVGSWENGTGYLRGHYAGHFMSMLAQAHASTGEPIFKQKLDYMVNALAECQAALAESAKRATPRVDGRFALGLQLTGSPIGLAEHVALPAGVLRDLRDFSIALWINPAQYARERLSDSRPTVDLATLTNGTAIFDFGTPNSQFAEPAQMRMYLTMRASNGTPVPRFAITTTGVDGEQRLDATQPLAIDRWTHLAITRRGSVATLYVDGQAVASNPAMTLGPADLGATTANWLGRCQFPQRNVSYLNARLCDVHIFDRALSAEEVQSLQASATGTTGGGNVLAYHFDEAPGARVEDRSGRGHHGTVIAPTDGRRHPGFLSAYPETQFVRLEEFATYGGNQGIWAPYYTLHKILAGLLDAHTQAGNAQALEVASKIGDWVYSRLSKLRPEQFDRMWNLYIAGEYGGANDAFASLHALRPDKPEYLTVARYFDNRNVKDPVVAGTDMLDGRHANQHIPQFTGYLRVFEQSGVPEYHAAARNFWDMIVPHRVYSHGGLGVGEILRKRDVIAGSLWSEPNNRDHAETCCVYNMLKLSRNLFFHDPDPKYMHYYELGLFNQILGSRRDTDSVTSPEVTYFQPVRPGERRNYGNVGTCCGGTGLENHTKYQDSIYFRSADDRTLYVNLYIPSVLVWSEKGLTIEQVTRYPLDGVSTLTVRRTAARTSAQRFAISLRVPAWVTGDSTVSVNGKPQRVTATPGRYVTIDREWKSGDTIAISLPMQFRVERTIDDPAVQSIYYGPTLLAVQAPPVIAPAATSAPGQSAAAAQPNAAVGAQAATASLETGLLPVSLYRHFTLSGDFGSMMTPVPNKPLHFTVGGLMFAPLSAADPQRGPTQPYHMYLRRHEPEIAFGGVEAGVANTRRGDGQSFLDVVWSGAPFRNHAQLVQRVERVAAEWQAAGRVTSAQQTNIVGAARRAARTL